MKRYSTQPRRTGLLAVAFAMVCAALACMCALPTTARADSTGPGRIYAKLGNEYYTSAEAAIESSYILNGATIVMQMDWTVDNAIEIPEGQKVSIDMNGYSIASKKYAVFVLGKGSKLTLTTNSDAKDTEITYRGYEGTSTAEHSYTVKTGGLLTSAPSAEINFTIWMKESSVLNLDGVTIAGSKAQNAGGVHMGVGTTLNMTNGASIQHNRGSGVHAYEKNIHINMDNASISGNTLRGSGQKFGGGIDSGEENFTLTMTNGSKIDGNYAVAGGGIYLNKSHFTVTSPDNSGVISNNTATGSDRSALKTDQSGGGIHVDQREYGANDGLIEGLTISGNYSAYDGGGIELDQEYITIRNCVIKDNWCKYEGGGVYVCNDGNLIDGCTITGNACSVDSGGNYEGGGVFVWHSYDIKLAGLCVIKGNTRGKGTDNADDVMLRENAGGTAKAYITGTLAKGSSVGVRSGVTGDRRIAKKFKPETKDCLFYDMDDYYVSYGSDENGDAWQRHTTKEFAAKINGEVYGNYRNGTAATVVAPATKDNKVFWRWDTKYTTGLNPIGDYITQKNVFSNALAFTMPQNEVDLAPLYVDRVTSALLVVPVPEAGKAIPTAGQIARTDGGVSGTVSMPCAVYWYEVGKDGKVSDTAAAGVAKANTTYQAYVSAPESAAYGFFYSESMGTKDVTLRLVTASGETVSEDKAADAYTTLSNSLAARTAGYTTGAGEGKETKAGTVKVQMKNKGLLGEGEAAVAALALDDSGDANADAQAALIGTVDVSYSYDEDTQTVTITAPEQEGFNFCNWEVTGDAVMSDEDTVTIPVADLLKIESLTAAYTPIATSLDVKLDAPQADKELSATCADIVATCSDGKTVNLAEGFDVESFDVTWSPQTEDGKAGFSTSYTALIKLSDEEGFEDVEKALASAAPVTCNGKAVDAAGFTLDADGHLCLALSFGETRAVKATGLTQPAAVEVSFEDAAAGEWGLPKTVDVALENGEVAEGDVEWEAVEGFNASATAAQELTVKGTVTHVAYDGDLDTDGLDTAVTVTVKVAAPDKKDDGEKKDDAGEKKDDGEKDDSDATGDATKTETTATTETKAAKSKKGTPSTGDVTWGGFAGLLAVAAVCLVAARVSRREH